MNKGEGETSYAKNSLLQKKIISAGSSMVESAIVKILLEVQPQSMGVADLGGSSGPNSLTVISKIIHLVDTSSRQMGRPVPELRLSLNDLPGNDFNDVFESLHDCFPLRVHFVHSSSSLHWLSQVPLGLETRSGTHLNKEKLYISKHSSASVVEAYQRQFHEDFSMFLRSRAKEIVTKGRMGLVKKEKIDSFNAPYYAPSPEEVKFEVEKEGSFLVDRVEAFEIEWDGGDSGVLKDSSGKRVAKTIRAVVEPMLAIHFDLEPVMMDELFRSNKQNATTYLSELINQRVLVSIIDFGPHPPPPSHPSAATIQAAGNPHPAPPTTIIPTALASTI
nr:jasmonate O-methyltransferase-like [Tanacetum cinerariifolium]